MWFTHDFIINYLFKFNENKNNEIRLLLLTVLNIQTLDISSNVLVVIWGYTRNYRYNDFFWSLYKESLYESTLYEVYLYHDLKINNNTSVAANIFNSSNYKLWAFEEELFFIFRLKYMICWSKLQSWFKCNLLANIWKEFIVPVSL